MEEIEKNTFEWSVDRFLERKCEVKRSSKFEIWRNTCNLHFPARAGRSSTISQYFTLYLEHINSTCRDERSLKLCLIGENGKQVFVVNRTLLQILPYDQFLLMTFRDDELRENANDLLPGGTLTVRLSWYDTRIENRPETLLTTLSKDLSCFYESKANTDCILRIGDDKFPVHRAVLSARSPVFAAMFHHDTSETRSSVVDILDVEATVLNDCLHYIYSGKVHGLTINTVCPLYIVADKYALIELKHICVEFLKNTLTIGNICNIAVFAHTQGEKELEKKVVQFIQDKLEEVQDIVEWKTLSSSKPSLVIKLLSYTVFACKDKIKKISEK